MSWVDTHCHLHLSDEKPEQLMRRAGAAGVEWVVCPGTNLETARQASRLHQLSPDRILWSAGLHPHEADQWPQQRDEIADLAGDAHAVGECGLDFYRNLAPRSAQIEAFFAQIELAQQLAKPVIVHCRDAFTEVYDAIERTAPAVPVVLHCWTGGPKWTRRFRELDVFFSFAGPVAFETGDTVRRGAAEAPPERTMIETDTPYLSPPPHRGEPNEPARVVAVGEALAGVWGVDSIEVARSTSSVATRVFGR